MIVKTLNWHICSINLLYQMQLIDCGTAPGYLVIINNKNYLCVFRINVNVYKKRMKLPRTWEKAELGQILVSTHGYLPFTILN